MIGLNVYNPNNEKIGDISEILMDKNGNAEVVVIGVGGFLGIIGTKDVAVPFKSLQWKMDPQAPPAEPVVARAQGYPDHAVLNMTQDQLKTAPDFKYVGSASESIQQPSTPAPK